MDSDRYDNEIHQSIITIPSSGAFLLITRYNIISTNLFKIEQVKNFIEDTLSVGESQKTISLMANKYWSVENTDAVLVSWSGWKASEIISVKEGEQYKIYAQQGPTHKTRIWIITDDELNILDMADDYYNAGFITDFCSIPQGGTKLLITSTTNGNCTLYQKFPQVQFIKQALTENEKEQARNNISAANFNDTLMDERISSFTLRGQYFWNVETGVAVYTPISSNWMASSIIPVSEGEIYTVSGDQGASHKVRIWAVTDDFMNILSMATDYYAIEDWRTETFIIPEGGTKLVLCTRSNVGSPYVYCYKKTKIKEYILNENKILKGKTVAIIGDSISTNGDAGTDPNVCEIEITTEDINVPLSAYLTSYDVNANLSLGGHTFTNDEIGTEVTFTPLADDVGKKIGLPNNYNPNSTTVWWEIMQQELGNNTIPVCWSGSSITSHEDSSSTRKTSYAWHPAQIRKCGIRVPGTMTRVAPDIIIIYRGTNDFSHAPYTKITENYFNTVNWQYPETDIITNGYGYLEGLALTIKKLRETYPNAQIYLCTLNIFKRINYAHFPTNNGLNTLPEYNNAIREAANFFGCGLIEFDKDGITFENCYSEGYITDSSTIPTHPSDKGHAVMGRKAIADIKAQYNNL